MKSGLAAMISAAVSVAGDKRPKKAGLKLVITAAEEESCQGACFLNKQGVLGKAGALIICEPTSNFPFAGHKGSLWLKVKINGRSAHGSMPEKGDNAIYKAAETILKLKDFTFPEPDENKAWRTTLNVGKIFGGVSYNLVPDFSEFLIDIRTAPGTDHGGIIQSIRNILPEDSELTVTSDQPGFASARCPWIDEIFKSASEVLGALPEPDIITYFTDAPALLAAFGNPPAVIWGPGEASQAHQTDEYCYVHRIREATRMYRKAAEKWCFGGSV
jgi:succinyl-diaminopimelate desuccinylase